MVIERNRWVRRLLVVQPAVLWPVSFVLWSGGEDIGLAVAVILLWASACISIAGIVVPMRRGQMHGACQTPRVDHGFN